jgi:hypothetical protein
VNRGASGHDTVIEKGEALIKKPRGRGGEVHDDRADYGGIGVDRLDDLVGRRGDRRASRSAINAEPRGEKNVIADKRH